MKRVRREYDDIFERIFIKKGRLNIGLISTLMLVLVLCLSIGYSAFSSNLNISGIVTQVRIKKDVRVTGVSVESQNTNTCTLVSDLDNSGTLTKGDKCRCLASDNKRYDYIVLNVGDTVNLVLEDSLLIGKGIGDSSIGTIIDLSAYNTIYIEVNEGETYTFTGFTNADGLSLGAVFYDESGARLSSFYEATKTVPKGAKYMARSFLKTMEVVKLESSTTTNNSILNIPKEEISVIGSTTYLEYNVSNVQAGLILPNENSSVTLKVQITNIGNAEVGIKEITGLPDNLDYELLDYTLKDKICVDDVCKNGIVKEITLKLKYKENGYDSSNTEYNIVADLNFQQFYTITYTDITGASYVCKRATALHEETCVDGSCISSGYTNGDIIKYGQTGDFENLVSGDAFDCDINGDGDYDSETERFYYVSDYYDQSTDSYDENTAVLIYYNNILNGLPNNTSEGLIAYYLPASNNLGPISAAVNLPKFSNISLINPIRQIVNEIGSTTTNSLAISTFDYSEYSARLLTAQEANSGCGITVGTFATGELDGCEYLMENTKFSSSSLLSGYWLETPHSTMSRVWHMFSDYRRISYSSADVSSVFAVRPVIEVAKSDIDIKGVGSEYQTEILSTDTLTVDFGEDALPGVKVKINDIETSNYTYEDGVLTVPNVTGDVEVMDGIKTSTSTDNKVVLANVTYSDVSNYRIYGNTDEYQIVEYIESTGTQYIDTGIIPNQDTGFDIVFLSKNGLDATTYGSIMGARENSVVRELQLTTFTPSTDYQGTLRFGANAYNVGLTANTKMHITLKNKNYTNNSDVSYTFSGTFESPVTLTVFALNQLNVGAYQNGSLQLYSLKLYDGDTLIRDYIPCYRVSDGEIGLLDLVENKFYKNEGTGTFLKGNDVSDSTITSYVGDYTINGENSGKYNIPVVVSGKNILNKSDSKISEIRTESAANLWASVIFDSAWMKENLKPNTTYTISYDIECVDIPEYDEQYATTLGLIIYKYENGYQDAGMYFHTNKYLQEGETIHLVKTFTTPSDILEANYEMLAYGNLYRKDGVNVTTSMIFSNIQIEYGSVETSYEPYYETKTDIYLDEPLRILYGNADYIDFVNQQVVRYVEVQDGVLTSLSTPITSSVYLPNISLEKGYNTIFVDTSVSPSKIEIDYY